MKLFYSRGACSLAPHILLRELRIDHTLETVDSPGQKYGKIKGEDFLKINPKGYVPALALDSGDVLTECIAILQYLAESEPAHGLFPSPGSFGRYRVIEWLGFSSELQKSIVVLLSPTSSSEHRSRAQSSLRGWLAQIETHLAGKIFLVGAGYTIADIFLFVVMGWLEHVDISLDQYPNLSRYFLRLAERPAVREAMAIEESGFGASPG